ncbi:hypothetical protein ALP67_200019 [Pseudomonas ficuserectae]|nr:hypothetical protein ALP67_200019 [Pseudomonas ficuserectae]
MEKRNMIFFHFEGLRAVGVKAMRLLKETMLL